MPDYVVRRRPGYGPLRLEYWINLIQAQAPVILTFAIACLLGIVAVTVGLRGIMGGN